ncbi:MAG: LuxR C-terminal-related transcriptional regulator [Treponemataceae bacterium]
MKAYLIVAVVISVNCLFLGIIALQGKSRRVTRCLFFLMCCCLAWFLLTAGLSVSGGDKREVVFWYHLSAFGFAPFYALNLHFFINLTYGPRIRRKEFLLYLPIPIIILATFFSHSLFNDFIFINGYWRFSPAYSSPWFWVYVLYIFPYTAAVMPIIHLRARRTGLARHRKQAFFITIFTTANMLIGGFADTVLTGIPSYVLPPLGPLTMGIYVFGLWISLMRFNFLEPTPAMVADTVIDNIQEMVFLLDPGFVALHVNPFARARLALPEGPGRREIYFPSLTAAPESTRRHLDSFSISDKENESIQIEYAAAGGPIHADSFMARLRDNFNDVNGYLIISRENKGRHDFVDAFKTTNRELEIIDLCLAGLTNGRIARKLNISDRTVETHLTNIFNKTGANNRMELFALAEKYDISGSKAPV